jgi:hypothetical protein
VVLVLHECFLFYKIGVKALPILVINLVGGVRNGLVQTSPVFLSITLERGWDKPINAPKVSLRLVNVILVVVAFVSDVRLQDLLNTLSTPVVLLCSIVQANGDVIYRYTDERLVRYFSALPQCASWHWNEINNCVECGQANAGVKRCDIFCECLLRCIVKKDTRSVVDKPERHYGMLVLIARRVDVGSLN